jgi:DnaJ-class molecular chaperone
VNTYQALRILNVDQNSSQDEIKTSYRKMALEVHPDRNNQDDSEFKKITEAYNFLKENKNHVKESQFSDYTSNSKSNFKKKTQWGAPNDQKIPEQDWRKYTRVVEEEDPDFWKEYEKQFWKDYNARVSANKEKEDQEETKKQSDFFINVDESLCIACCSCEVIAPNVFEINKKSMLNPKSSVINQNGAGINKIMDAAQTCPTKAINIENTKTRERIYPI